MASPADFPPDLMAGAAPPERPQVASMLDGGADGEGRPLSQGTPGQRPSRKVMAGAAALAVLVVAGGVTALRTPMLSNLLSHHTTHGTTATSAPRVSGSPVPTAQRAAKPASSASAGSSPGTSATDPARGREQFEGRGQGQQQGHQGRLVEPGEDHQPVITATTTTATTPPPPPPTTTSPPPPPPTTTPAPPPTTAAAPQPTT